MLGLYPQGLHLPVLLIVNGGQGTEASGLKIALIIDMAPEIIKNSLDRTRVGEEGKAMLERQSVS